MGLYVLLAGVVAASVLLARELGRVLVPWWRARRLAQEARARERAAALEPGGAPDRPLEVGSASVVEVRARSIPCVRCEVPTRVEEHAAELHDGAHLRVARLVCPRCARRRAVYFRIRSGIAPQA